MQDLIARLSLPPIPRPLPLPSLLSYTGTAGDPLQFSSFCQVIDPQSKNIHERCRPIPSMTDDQCDEFWRGVPTHSRTKLQKKWLAQLTKGVLTQKDYEHKLEQLQATAKSDKTVNSTDPPSANKGIRKRQQVQNIEMLLQDCRRRWDNEMHSTGTYPKLPRHNSDTTSKPKCTPNKASPTTKYSAIVVDFGSGSGNLTLPLAATHRDWLFVPVDQKGPCLELTKHLIQESKLTNVVILQYQLTLETLYTDFVLELQHTIQAADGLLLEQRQEGRHGNRLFDLGIGWHSCGSFTDMAMDLCTIVRADCIVCPCCNGGLETTAHVRLQKKSTKQYSYPRSTWWKTSADDWLQQSRNVSTEQSTTSGSESDIVGEEDVLLLETELSELQYLTILCKAADHNRLNNCADTSSCEADGHHAASEKGMMVDAKAWMELDRFLWAYEQGTCSKIHLFALTPLSCSPKHHVIYLTTEIAKHEEEIEAK